MSKKVFSRCEKKFLLSNDEYTKIKAALNEKITNDEYNSYTITNIYYDTDDYDLIRMSIEKPCYKEKLRLRSYGVPQGNEKVFLELKKKYDGIVYKRREKLYLHDAESFVRNRTAPQTQILKEIGYFLSTYDVSKKAFISYDREAYCGVEDPSLRITFDSNILFREECLEFNSGIWGTPLISTDQRIMEIKFANAFPLWITGSLSELGIFSAPFSKYGVAYKKYIMEREFLHRSEGGVKSA